ncbi:protein FAM207A isoform X2 [Oryx dammah]|uniref:protein FAM207A isoform X2 n=1 Tax=Oryx dammah TaxID=59534 RepID=UPI001A9AA793|nr:protein FAM207A isoform X2 [Oryx dammah]
MMFNNASFFFYGGITFHCVVRPCFVYPGADPGAAWKHLLVFVVKEPTLGSGQNPLGLWEQWLWELACVHANVFAGTTIEPSALVQKLDLETRSVTSVRRGAEAKTILPKKEKLKLRRERWLQKIEAIKLAEQKRKAERRRRATVVVGDLQPLRDALPELLELEASGRRPPTRRAASRPRPAELSRMSAVQRLQLLEEERTRFQELLASPAYRASPLLAIGRQLAEQMQLEGSGQP